jgi:hypothetical protein
MKSFCFVLGQKGLINLVKKHYIPIFFSRTHRRVAHHYIKKKGIQNRPRVQGSSPKEA